MKPSVPPTSAANAVNAAAEAGAGAAAGDVTVAKMRVMALARTHLPAKVHPTTWWVPSIGLEKKDHLRRRPPTSARRSIRRLNRLVSSPL